MQPENRRSFVKKSVATTISLSSATFFSSLIRARGDEGGETTTEVFETTFSTTVGTTEFFDTTIETTNGTAESTIDPFETTSVSMETTEETVVTTVITEYDIASVDCVCNGSSTFALDTDGYGESKTDPTYFPITLTGVGATTSGFFKLKTWREAGEKSPHARIVTVRIEGEAWVSVNWAAGVARRTYKYYWTINCDPATGDLSVTNSSFDVIPTTGSFTWTEGGNNYDVAVELTSVVVSSSAPAADGSDGCEIHISGDIGVVAKKNGSLIAGNSSKPFDFAIISHKHS